MKRFGMRRAVRYGGAVGVLMAVAVAIALAAATAQAAPSTKSYTVQVAVTNDALSHQNFTVTIKNDAKSNQTLGSVNVTAPSGFVLANGLASRGGWIAHPVGNVLQFRSTSNALAPGQSMTATVDVTSPASLPTQCASATWSAQAKQSNDFNGTNNWFNLLPAGTDLTPLGSFAWDPIGTLVNGVFAPAILTGTTFNATVDALDTCGALKAGYNGPTSLAYNGHQAIVSGPTWSGGIGTASIKPTVSETSRNLSLTDITTGISAPSDPFDTQDKICTSVDTSCTWHNGNNSINANANGPATGSLGVGFDPVGNVNFVCGNGSGGALGGAVISISPHDTPAGAYQVTLVYSKQVSGTGNANGFIFCESIDNGASFNQLPSCSVSGTGVDCVVDQKRVTGGALQVILSLLPGDPYVGGK